MKLLSPVGGSPVGALLALGVAIVPVLPVLQAGEARAMVPYVYVPPERDLEAAGLGIAQAAARLLRLGQAEEAARLAELTVRLLPGDPRGWVLLAEAQLRSDRIDKALWALGKAKQLDPQNPGIWFAEGSLALRNQKPQEAIELLNRGLQLEGRNAGAHFDLGNAQLLLGQSERALGSYEKAAKLRRDFWEAINNQGLVLWELGRRPAALERWRQVLRIKPDVPETSLALAAGLFASDSAGQRAEALRLAEMALNEEPNYVLDSYQSEQLWGEKLRGDTRRLLSQPELKLVVERAMANATAGDDKGTGE
ncbi:MAG: tetratricopeptide repeat protein [Synechococcaceae cyanobacterium]